MLNGLDPIIIFNFKKIPAGVEGNEKIPLVASIVNAIPLPAIPIYLSERLTGVYIDSEDKNIDIHTETKTLSDGGAPEADQRGISSIVTINMIASKNSLGVALFSALADLVFPKVTSKEYSITYLHGAVTVFGGLLNSFSITQNANDDRFNIVLSLIKPPPVATKTIPEVAKNTGTIPVGQVAIGGGG